MRLVTLGGLTLEGADFARVKPLVLVAYLALEGAKERRYLAELFWGDARAPLNSLSVTLMRLRKSVPGIVGADDIRAWSETPTDVLELLAALAAGDSSRALALYHGPFLEGVYLAGLGPELEEWVYSRREDLAGRVRLELLSRAEADAARGHFAVASQLAERAQALAGAPPPDPEDLRRLYLLLQAGESPTASLVRDDALGYGVSLHTARDEARTLLQRALIGRGRERQRLSSLAPGEWAWLRGGAGMGKTALLKTLPGTLLLGRSGLPYATLEPLVGSTPADETTVLQTLAAQKGTLLFDPWERIDADSQRVLLRLRALRPQACVIIASRDAPALETDLLLELAPLPAAALAAYPDAWEHTHGLPALVEAYLRGESLETALEARLATLSKDARDIYLALALLEAPSPDVALVRRALGVGAAAMAAALETLLAGGLIEPSGGAQVKEAALEYLEMRPTLFGDLALRLARQHEGVAAFPLYQRARALWDESDEPKVMEAYLAWATELLRRGFPQRAAETLTEAPAAPAVTSLRARALERSGRYQEAFACLAALVDTPAVLALKATLYRHLGRPDDARHAAEQALAGDTPARAEAHNTLGQLALETAAYAQAASLFRRAAALWLAAGEHARWVGALNNVAVTRTQLGEDADEAFRDALQGAGDNLALRANVLLNLGWAFERRGNIDEARAAYRDVITVSSKVGGTATAAYAWNNLGHSISHGISHGSRDHPHEAKTAYANALALARESGETYLTAVALANLADLEADLAAWEEAMHLFRSIGRDHEVVTHWDDLSPDHPFRAKSGVNR